MICNVQQKDSCALQDYDTQLQRALNYEDYELANQIRQRRQSVDEAMDRLKAKFPPKCCQPAVACQLCALSPLTQALTGQGLLQVFKSGDEDFDSGMSVEDYPSQEVILRVQLQRAIEEER